MHPHVVVSLGVLELIPVRHQEMTVLWVYLLSIMTAFTPLESQSQSNGPEQTLRIFYGRHNKSHSFSCSHSFSGKCRGSACPSLPCNYTGSCDKFSLWSDGQRMSTTLRPRTFSGSLFSTSSHCTAKNSRSLEKGGAPDGRRHSM